MSSPLLYAKTDDGYYFKPSQGHNAVLHVGLSTTALASPEHFPISGINPVAAIIGVIQLRSSRYIIVATKTTEAGQIRQHSVHKITEYKVLPLSNSFLKDDDEQKYLELLKFQLDTAQLYFSYTYDLTNSHQRNSENVNSTNALWQLADTRFYWNYFISQDLIKEASSDARFSSFITPLIYGYVKVIQTSTNYNPISFGLITRRSRFRAGTRYFRRGIDEDGNVANFNETEQLLILHQSKTSYETYSYVQTRGSVPVFWAEINNLKYKPDLALGEHSLEPARKHFDSQVKLYGDNYLVNLVNAKGYEKPVKDAYENLVDALGNPKVHYTYFDYHHECRKLQWHRVKILIDHLTKIGLSNEDFYHESRVENTLKVLNLQKSVVRTNCMDCLDRTNVVQSTLGHWVLQREFELSGILPAGSIWEHDKALLFQFQNIWADNADAVSKAYSGTGALKTDYTRTGKRTKKGALNDLLNSITRYYRNNLKDGPRQDSFDLFLGNFTPNIAVESPFDDSRPQLVQAFPYLLFGSSFIFLATFFFPKGSIFKFSNVLILLSCLSVIGLSTRLILKNGIQYVNWPRLVRLEFLDRQEVYNEGKYEGVRYSKNPKYHSPTTVKKD